MPEYKKNTLMPTLAMIAITLLWGGSFSMIKLALAHYHVLMVTFLRMVIAAALFALCWRSLRHVRVLRCDIPPMLGMIICEPCLFFTFEAYALYYTTASQAGMIVALTPMIIAAAAFVFLKERPGPLVWIGFAVAIAGVMLLSYDADATLDAPNPILGNFLEGLAMITAAGFVICLKKLKGTYPPLFLGATQAFGGAIFFIFALFLPGVHWPSSWPLIPTLAIGYLGILITFLGISLYNYALPKLPATRSAGLLNLVSVFAVFFGVILLGESLTWLQWAACGLVLLGVFISRRSPVKT
jgi:drug/metabolite transporter (DMT)-like permease